MKKIITTHLMLLIIIFACSCSQNKINKEDLIKKKYEIVSRYNIWNFNFNSDNTYQIEQFDNQKAKEFVMTGKYELKDDTPDFDTFKTPKS